jgi:hypothetical protein
MTARTTRQLLRGLHLAGAALVGTYVYAPWQDVAWFALLVKAVVVPGLTVSGLWMWLGHRIGRRAA